jgi:hypothetical protein
VHAVAALTLLFGLFISFLLVLVPRHPDSALHFRCVGRLPVEQNVRKSFEDSQQKSKTLEPDAVFYFPEQTLWVDLSVTEPTAPSALNRNMIEAGSAMNARADHKNAKYLRKAQSMDADFSPLVVETHGRFHAGFTTLLKRLATQLDGGQGLTAREMAVLLNLDLIKGNAAHAAKVKSRVWMAWHKNKEKRDKQAE